MNEFDFVKKHGWEAVIDAVKNTSAEETAAFESKDVQPTLSEGGYVVSLDVRIHSICYNKVKALVDSYELINKLGGIESVREGVLKIMEIDGVGSGMNVTHDGEWVGRLTETQLKKAILDVESCKGVYDGWV